MRDLILLTLLAFALGIAFGLYLSPTFENQPPKDFPQ